MNVEVVRYHPALRWQVLALGIHLWSKRPRLNAAYLHWKYESNPYSDRPRIYVATVDDKVVAMRGMYGGHWITDDPSREVPCICAGDLVIAPEYRNRSLFTQIMRVSQDDLADAGFEYVFSLSASRVTQLGSLAMGWRSAGTLLTKKWSARRDTRSRRRIRPVRTISKRWHPFGSFDSAGHRSSKRAASPLSASRTPRPDEMSRLATQLGDGRLRHAKEPQFFAWRFGNPLSEYRFLFWDDPELAGYIVLSSPRSGRRSKISVVDWEACDIDVFRELMATALRWGDFDDVTILTPPLPQKLSDGLTDIGFRDVAPSRNVTDFRPTVLVKPVRDECADEPWELAGRNPLNLGDWDYRMIFSDSF